ncbi:MAG: LCP family protein [Lachnospiraceae bacterium]|nr:LCP family protein [Lachnospiraceae bacterium]
MARRYDDDDDDRYDDRYDDYDEDDEDYDDDYDDDDYDDRRPVRKSSKKSSRSGGRSSGRSSSSGGSKRSSGSRKNKNSGEMSGRKKRAVVIFAIEIVALLGLLVAAYKIVIPFTNMGRVELKTIKISKESGTVDLKENEVIVNEAVADNQEMQGYRNIALFGVDARDKQLKKNTRSDTIMICSINQESGDIRLVSVYRDTYLNLSNDSYNKCNAAYANGGPAQAISMLNMNLDLDISDFVTVGFTGLTQAIDELGGIQVDVESAVIDHLNNYQISMVGKKDGTNAAGEDNFVATAGKDYIPVTQSGMQTLNGLQATAYCRIRYVGDDFARAERQRRVLTATLEKAKKSDVNTLTKIADKVFDKTYTSLDLKEIVELLGGITKYNVVGDEGFPVEEFRATGNMGSKYGSCVLPMDLQANVKWLHGFLFDDKDYTVTADVQDYSDKIAADVARLRR